MSNTLSEKRFMARISSWTDFPGFCEVKRSRWTTWHLLVFLSRTLTGRILQSWDLRALVSSNSASEEPSYPRSAPAFISSSEGQFLHSGASTLPNFSPARGWRAPGPVLPSARRRDACTKDGSRLSFSAISSGKYFSSPIARTSDRAWAGANPARSHAAVPGSRRGPSFRPPVSAALAPGAAQPAPVPASPAPLPGSSHGLSWRGCPRGPPPPASHWKRSREGGAPAEAAVSHWAGPHVESPEWQEAAAEGRGRRSAGALSWLPQPSGSPGLSNTREPVRTARRPGCPERENVHARHWEVVDFTCVPKAQVSLSLLMACSWAGLEIQD